MTVMTKSTVSVVSLGDAKAKLAECVRQAESGGSVVITRHGKAVAAIVSNEDFEALRRLRAAGPEGGLASVLGGWSDSDELAETLDQHHRTPVRAVRVPDKD